MYCKICNYTSFDHLPTCPKCGYEWDSDREKLNLKWIKHNKIAWLTWEEAVPSEKINQKETFSFILEDNQARASSGESVQSDNIANRQTEPQTASDDVEIDLEFSLVDDERG